MHRVPHCNMRLAAIALALLLAVAAAQAAQQLNEKELAELDRNDDSVTDVMKENDDEDEDFDDELDDDDDDAIDDDDDAMDDYEDDDDDDESITQAMEGDDMNMGRKRRLRKFRRQLQRRRFRMLRRRNRRNCRFSKSNYLTGTADCPVASRCSWKRHQNCADSLGHRKFIRRALYSTLRRAGGVSPRYRSFLLKFLTHLIRRRRG